ALAAKRRHSLAWGVSPRFTDKTKMKPRRGDTSFLQPARFLSPLRGFERWLQICVPGAYAPGYSLAPLRGLVLRQLLIGLLISFLIANSAFAQPEPPNYDETLLAAIYPAGAQRGTTVSVELRIAEKSN